MKQYIRLVCNGIANFIMLGIIVISIPITIPKLFQIEVMEVVSGSMEPELPIGCLVYCSPIDSEELLVGDIITYRIQNQGDESYFVTHRVVDNQIEAGFVETKGDANISSDQSLVAYSDIVGKVIFKIPLLGKIASFMHSYNGIYIIICLFSITIILWIIGDIIKRCSSNSSKEKEAKKLEKRVKLQIGGGIVLFLSAIGIIASIFPYFQARKEYKEARNAIKFETSTENIVSEDINEEKRDLFIPEQSIIDTLLSLQKDYENMIAWITFDSNEINYPVMYCGDNQYYLTHTYKGTENKSGSLFLEAANLSDFSDHHSIIYGHNMKDGSMFGSLKKYQDKEYWIDNQYFTLYTTNAFRRFQIVGVQIVDQNSEVYTVGFLPDQEYEEFIKQLSKGLLYDTGLEVTKEDYLLSLSTCTYSNEKRLVIHAKQID